MSSRMSGWPQGRPLPVVAVLCVYFDIHERDAVEYQFTVGAQRLLRADPRLFELRELRQVAGRGAQRRLVVADVRDPLANLGEQRRPRNRVVVLPLGRNARLGLGGRTARGPRQD